jgi:DNA repair exonuclease SbcCD ATPase subunit
MISQLRLKNWRNYDDLVVDLGEGTTFVVASNGVGKTSLVEAARFALFNVAPVGGASAIRVGADAATASVELTLPDGRKLSVQRTLAKRGRGRDTAPTVVIDDVEVSPNSLGECLITAYKADPGFLANLTMPSAHPEDGEPSKLGLEDHLGQYYGVTGLRQAVDRLKVSLKETDSRIKQVKAANATSADVMMQLQEAVEQAADQVRQATQRRQVLQHRLERTQEQQRQAVAAAKWQEEWTMWSHGIEELATQLSDALDREVTAADFDAALHDRLAVLEQQLERTRIEIGINQGSEQAIRTNQARLESAEGDCPVCRRPLDSATLTLAQSANNDDLSAIAENLQSLRVQESDLTAALDRLKRLESDRRRLRQPAENPAAALGAEEDEEEEASAEQLGALGEEALSVLVDARAAHVGATRALDDARAADHAMHELEALFQRQASIRVAIETTESTLSELLNETIHPLAVEVDLRWKALFPGRGNLTTSADGGISRTVNGHPLPYDSFSTGEGMGATILMRLLVAQMATNADFCWFDEPLEHLDPDVRRRVANLLSRVTTTGGPLRQVVVTTYEEPLARHLESRDPFNVRLIDVRQAI